MRHLRSYPPAVPLLAAALLACAAPRADADRRPASAAPVPAPAARSAGCAHPAFAPGLTPHRVRVGNDERTYLLAVPAGDPARPRPLVLVFHGTGGTGAGIQSFLGEQLEEAAAGAAVFAYPDALGAGWPDDDGRDVAFFDALLADAGAGACLDLGRVFATGFSYGAVMANTLGCARAGVVRGIAPLSGCGPFRACGPGAVAALVVHGTDDGAIELAGGEGSRDRWRRAAGCAASAHPVDPAPCVAYDGCGAHPVVWCAFDGGHQVPDFAAGAVWSFFDRLR